MVISSKFLNFIETKLNESVLGIIRNIEASKLFKIFFAEGGIYRVAATVKEAWVHKLFKILLDIGVY